MTADDVAAGPVTGDVGIFICPVCEAVIEGDKPCPRRGLKQHGADALAAHTPSEER